jgi:DNA-binding winged helix-turn-helix (wHTH) protein
MKEGMERKPEFVFPPFRLDCVNECLWREEKQFPLRGKTFAVLRCLLESHGQLVTKATLFTAVWPDTYVNEGALTICIAELRKALGDSARQPRYIETVHRRGYRFLPAVLTQPVQSAKFTVQSASPSSRLEISHLKPETLLVGREAELAQLHGWWEKALNGERQIVFVSGEAGIGKMTLVESFLAVSPSETKKKVKSQSSKRKSQK